MLRLYDRPTGVICLETDLFENERRLPELLAALPDTGLCWHWSSTRRYPAQPAYAGLDLPASRPWTLLPAGQADALLADFSEMDSNDDRRTLTVAAADVALVEELRSEAVEKQLIAAFAQEQPPLRLVMHQLGDSGSAHLFVPHAPVEAIGALLMRWGIDPARAERAPYRRLRLASLEALFDLE